MQGQVQHNEASHAESENRGALELLWVHNLDERKCRGIKPNVFMASL
jgi:hypothetical protein